MTSLSQSVAHLTFTHSQIYTATLQPTIELLLKSTKKPPKPSSSDKKPLKPPQVFEDPLVVFDHELRKMRKVSPKDGIFYYLCMRPSVLHEARNREYLRPRKLRFLILITMNSQTRDEYENTIFGIYENLKSFKDVGVCNEDIAVVTIIDGCLKMDLSMKEFFKQEDKFKCLDEKKTLYFRSKVFETPHRYPEFHDFPRDSLYMYQMSVRPQGADMDDKNNYLNVFLCTKLESTGKLGSHLWFFRGFSEMFNPEYCCMIEAGTKPSRTALFEFFKAMESDRQLGGVVGYISLFTEPTVDEFGSRIDEDSYKKIDMMSKLSFQFYDIQKAQVFEYAFDHILDKNFQSFFGFSHSMSSVFSAYRWDALKGDEQKSLLDDIYLRSLIDPAYVYSKDFTLEQANMHLAEDKILSLEIFCRKNFIVKYIPDAICWTGAAKYLLRLMELRRIDINSSWFAMLYVTGVCWKKVLESEHTALRLCAFYILMAYSTVNLLLFYFSVSFYCIILHLIANEFFSGFYYVANTDNIDTASASGTIMFVYLLFIASMLFCSLIYKSKEGIGQYQMATTGLGIFNLFCGGYFAYLVVSLLILQSDKILNKTVIYTNDIDRNWDTKTILAISNLFYLQVIGAVAAACYILPMILNPFKALVDILFSLKDYLFYFPMYIHTLLIYAFCNIDDLSGGTKVLKLNSELLKISNKYKIQYVYRWLCLNMLLSYVMIIVNTDPIFKNYFILVISFVFTANLSFKAFFAVFNHLKYYLYEKHYYNYKIKTKIDEYTARSKDLMTYINNIRKNISQGVNVNYSMVSMQYEDNTQINPFFTSNVNIENGKPNQKQQIEKDKDKDDLKLDFKIEKSNLGIVFEEEDSKHSSSEDPFQNKLRIEKKNENEKEKEASSPMKQLKKSVFNQKYSNNFGTNTKHLKEGAKLNFSGKNEMMEESKSLIVPDNMDYDPRKDRKDSNAPFKK